MYLFIVDDPDENDGSTPKECASESLHNIYHVMLVIFIVYFKIICY
jgi:hypothetical protein